MNGRRNSIQMNVARARIMLPRRGIDILLLGSGPDHASEHRFLDSLHADRTIRSVAFTHYTSDAVQAIRQWCNRHHVPCRNVTSSIAEDEAFLRRHTVVIFPGAATSRSDRGILRTCHRLKGIPRIDFSMLVPQDDHRMVA